ncbi:SIMPL domain-containing protein [Sphingomonas sp.]|uniref:SIMPL domain-containing protein n=1 Tax=Sphingomonas sp. TaxID=28214 RepID=UPI003B00C3D0
MRPILPLAVPVFLTPMLLAMTPATAQTIESVPVAGTILDVSATGRVSRVPDVATIRAGVVAQAPTAAAAVADQAGRMARVMEALKKAGVAPRDIATAQVELSPQYRYVENQPPVVTGYQATNSVAIRFRAIARAGRILDALVAAGANQIDGPDLTVDQPDAALDEARVDAVAKARARAELYAKAAGLHVRRIVSIGEGSVDAGSPRPPIMYARVAAAPQADTQIAAGEKDLSVTISVRFLLD